VEVRKHPVEDEQKRLPARNPATAGTHGGTIPPAAISIAGLRSEK